MHENWERYKYYSNDPREIKVIYTVIDGYYFAFHSLNSFNPSDEYAWSVSGYKKYIKRGKCLDCNEVFAYCDHHWYVSISGSGNNNKNQHCILCKTPITDEQLADWQNLHPEYKKFYTDSDYEWVCSSTRYPLEVIKKALNYDYTTDPNAKIELRE